MARQSKLIYSIVLQQKRNKNRSFFRFSSYNFKSEDNTKTRSFIKHCIDNYDNPSNPPAWMCFELLTIGELSNIYKGLKNNDDKKLITHFFDVHYTVLTS
ncbi:Abi family protein [Capnocytophaga sp. ARDL2]|uniref:Abi family protein n=1 Tax=Capnocytophaga sp. ARDL2 TaxID=3238809 RepID=UPI0035582FA6